MEMPGRNTENSTKRREDLSSDNRRTAFLRYHGERLKYAIQKGNRSTLLEAAISFEIFTDGNKAYFDGFIDHDRDEISLEYREAAISSTTIIEEYGATLDEAREALKRLESMGEIVFIRKYQPKKKLYLSVYKHSLFARPEWADMLYRGKFRPHAAKEIASKYKEYLSRNQDQAEQDSDPMEQDSDPMEPQKTAENWDFLSDSTEQNPTQFYNSDSFKIETSMYSSNGAEIPAEDKAAEDAPTASIQPPEVNTMEWFRLYGQFGMMVRDCEDPSVKERLTDIYHIMGNGAKHEKIEACSTLIAYREGHPARA